MRALVCVSDLSSWDGICWRNRVTSWFQAKKRSVKTGTRRKEWGASATERPEVTMRKSAKLNDPRKRVGGPVQRGVRGGVGDQQLSTKK